MKKNNINLLHADCIEAMQDIPDASINLVLTDLPYGITECKWDTIIPFDLMWSQLERITKNDAAIVLFASQPFTSALIASNYKLFKYEWIWIKSRPTGHLEAKNKPMKKHESILVFSKGASSNGCKHRITYNPQDLIPCHIQKKNYNTSIYGSRKSRVAGTIHTQKFTNYPNTVLNFKSAINKFHPSQKPIKLLEYLISTYTHANDTVLDFTMGSGSTGVACVNTHRNFIGVDNDLSYYNIACERIKKAQNELQQRLF